MGHCHCGATLGSLVRGATEETASDICLSGKHTGSELRADNVRVRSQSLTSDVSTALGDCWRSRCASYFTTEFRSTLHLICQYTNLVGRTGAYLSSSSCTKAKGRLSAARYAQEQLRRFREGDTRCTMPPWTCRFANAVEQTSSHRC